MDALEVRSLKDLRKKNKGKSIDIERVNNDYGDDDVFFLLNNSGDSGRFELRYRRLFQWSGDEITYTIYISTDKDGKITHIVPLDCERLKWDDIRGSGYCKQRADEYDYLYADSKLQKYLK